MAGEWIKIQHVTPDKPEIYQLASILGVTPEDAFGRCVRVWIWADQQSLNGHALSVTYVTLDSVARRDGFGEALARVGWIVDNGDGTITFPHFERHNGKTSKNRALAAERKAKQRSECHADVTQMSRNERDKKWDKSVTREEKRRIYITPNGVMSGNVPDDVISPPQDPPQDPPNDPPPGGHRGGYREVARGILEFLNQKAGRAYQPVDANLTLIVARLKEGYTEEDLRQIVAKKCRDWSADEKMSAYLRPATLFNASKCAQYRGELR